MNEPKEIHSIVRKRHKIKPEKANGDYLVFNETNVPLNYLKMFVERDYLNNNVVHQCITVIIVSL